ncbi:MAG TPA: hypothetical protein PKG90_06295 [Chitinophagaceae bacterium]|nr:hypothetical protein [Chitinophagaceae bacterium]
MRLSIYSSVLLLFIVSCSNNKPEEAETPVAEIYLWEAGLNDSTGLLQMKKIISPVVDSLSVASVTGYINGDDSNIQLEYVKTSGDTVFLKILDAEYLTQRMGSSGPTMYLAGVVYNFTEIPGIKYVNFDFEEGDHAQPGTYSRENFSNN